MFIVSVSRSLSDVGCNSIIGFFFPAGNGKRDQPRARWVGDFYKRPNGGGVEISPITPQS
ncbi:hypothetical protein ACISNP_09100 [Campylobacter jejuni]